MRSLYSPSVWIIVGGVAVAHGAVRVVGAVVSGPRGDHGVGVCAVHGVAPPRQRGAVVIVVARGLAGGHGEAASLGSGLQLRVARDYMGHHLSPVSGRKVNVIEEIFDITFLVLNQRSLCAVIFFSMKMCRRTI